MLDRANEIIAAFGPVLDSSGAFAHPVTRYCLLAIASALVLAPIVLVSLHALGKLSESTRADAWTRYWTWLVIIPVVVAPVLWCKLAAILLITLVALLAYREFARATGFFRDRLLSAIVALGIITMAIAALDHWYGLFVAVPPLGVAILAGVAVIKDQPLGYLQRISLGTVSLLLFGSGLMHLAYLTNSPDYRPILLMLLVATQTSDVAAYCFGKAFGDRRLFPNTSPRKTLAGHIGAFVVAVALIMVLAHAIFRGTNIADWPKLVMLGVFVAIAAQLGDLVLGSIKRDLGLKDLARFLPGHGGVTDRVNSLLLVAPIAFHYVGYLVGVGLDQPTRIFTGH